MKTAVLLLIWIMAGCQGHQRVELDPTNPWMDYSPQVVETYNGVPVKILDRLIQSESSWNMRAETRNKHEHSVGIAQINLRWITYFRERYGIEDPWKPGQSIEFASLYLKDLYLATGSWEEAVLAYKCGLAGRKNASEKIRATARWVAEGVRDARN